MMPHGHMGHSGIPVLHDKLKLVEAMETMVCMARQRQCLGAGTASCLETQWPFDTNYLSWTQFPTAPGDIICNTMVCVQLSMLS